MNTAQATYLEATPVIESNHPDIIAYTNSVIEKHQTPEQQAIALYYAVRDGIRYNPYKLDLSIKGFSASETLSSTEGWCIPKAILLAACCRAAGIPARLGFADVRNHLSTQRMRDTMKTDVFYWHGYTSIFLEGQWVKATPAFNIQLCEKFNLNPLEFDGKHDSLYHEFDQSGNQHMEYLADHGEFADLPLQEIIACYEKHYKGMADENIAAESFDADVNQETQTRRS